MCLLSSVLVADAAGTNTGSLSATSKLQHPKQAMHTCKLLHCSLVAEHILDKAVVLVLPEFVPVSRHHASTVLAPAGSAEQDGRHCVRPAADTGPWMLLTQITPSSPVLKHQQALIQLHIHVPIVLENANDAAHAGGQPEAKAVGTIW